MSPATKQRRVEEELPVRRTKDDLCPDTKRLIALADPVDQPLVLWEVIQGFSERLRRMKRGSPAFSKVQFDVFSDPGATGLTFPALLSSTPEISLDRDSLLTEIQLIIDMQQPSRFEGPHIYGIRAVRPTEFRFDALPEDLPYVGKVELRSGNLSHEILYSLSPERRSSLLESYLANAEAFEVTLRVNGQNTERKTVQLTGQAEPVRAGL